MFVAIERGFSVNFVSVAKSEPLRYSALLLTCNPHFWLKIALYAIATTGLIAGDGTVGPL